MFGKHFASMYSGSMFGKPAEVFAIWGYVISTMRPSRKDGACFVELNPVLLAATFASTPDKILVAIDELCSEDASSRSKDEGGRRLVPLVDEMHLGPMQFRVVNGSKYRALRDEEERRIYLRDAKRRERSRQQPSRQSTAVNRRQPQSTQAEAEAEAEAEANGKQTLVGSADVSAVFDHWRRVLEHPGAKLTQDRVRKIKARISEGYTVEQLCRAVDGCRASSYHRGQNDEGKVYDSVELIFRNGGHVERFIGYAGQEVQPPPQLPIYE